MIASGISQLYNNLFSHIGQYFNTYLFAWHRENVIFRQRKIVLLWQSKIKKIVVESRRAFNISNGIYWSKSCFLCLVDFKNNFLVETAETKRNCCCTIQEWIDGLFDVAEEEGLFLDKELIQWFYCMKAPVLYCKCNTTCLELKWEVHAMYSPDMIPSDCHLFHFRLVSLIGNSNWNKFSWRNLLN